MLLSHNPALSFSDISFTLNLYLSVKFENVIIEAIARKEKLT